MNLAPNLASGSPMYESKVSQMANEFPCVEQLAQAVRANGAHIAGQGKQAGLTVLYEQALLQAADHLRAESSSSAAVFESMAEQCPHAIANAFSNSGVTAAAAPESVASTLQHKVSLIVQTDKARMRDAIAKKKAEHDTLLAEQQDMADKRAVLEELAAKHSSVLLASRDKVSCAVQPPEEVLVPLHDHVDGEKPDAPSAVRASTVLVRPHVSRCDLYRVSFSLLSPGGCAVQWAANVEEHCTHTFAHVHSLALARTWAWCAINLRSQ